MRSAIWAREKEASSKCVPHSCATAGHAVTGAACRELMGLQQGDSSDKLMCLQPWNQCWDLPTGAARRKKGKQRKESRWRWGRRQEIELWFVAGGNEKASGEREVNPNPVRKKWRYLEPFRTWEGSESKIVRWDSAYWFYHCMQETCVASCWF